MPLSKEADAACKREERGAKARAQEKVALQSEVMPRAAASARAQEKLALQSEAEAQRKRSSSMGDKINFAARDRSTRIAQAAAKQAAQAEEPPEKRERSERIAQAAAKRTHQAE